ncbi:MULTISPECIES: hypothetical protein [unclassified Nocardia]|uniref:hypothetical protein n=1 Tax=unclassified Nocardia TaxID=2637762 RepID=UPI001CE454E8|nr:MULTISPECIES: hypothetical protein [unclassified Nocardia]
MDELIATDRDGRTWALVPVEDTVRARLIDGHCTPAVMDAVDLVDTYGPLTLVPARPSRSWATRPAYTSATRPRTTGYIPCPGNAKALP